MGRMEGRDLTGVSILAPLSRTPACYRSGRRVGSCCPGLSGPHLGPLVLRRAQRKKRELFIDSKLFQAGMVGKQMRQFFWKRGRLEVVSWGAGRAQG